jgi:hypothetical protein
MIGEEALHGAAPGWCFHLSPLSPETAERSSRKTRLNGDLACLQATRLEGAIRKIRAISVTTNGQPLAHALAVPGECTRTMNCPRGVRRACRAGPVAKAGSPPQAELFVYDLDLFIDHLPGKPVDRHVHPVALFALNDKLSQIGFSWRIFPALSDHINH